METELAQAKALDTLGIALLLIVGFCAVSAILIWRNLHKLQERIKCKTCGFGYPRYEDMWGQCRRCYIKYGSGVK